MGGKLSTKWGKKKQGRNRYDFTRRHRTHVDRYRPILAPGNGPVSDFLAGEEEDDELSSSYYDESSYSEDSSSWTTEQEKCYDPLDPTLTFVDGEDELDFLCNDYKSLRAKMSCGHAVTPMSLTDWCYWLLDEGECRFVCGQTNCAVEWPFDEVCKMALLTPDEIADFEKQMFRNGAKRYIDIKYCPGCKSRVVRTDLHDLSVECPVCTAERKRAYLFCWRCLNEWKGPAPRSDRCENEDCPNPVEVLKNCPDIIFEDVEGVKGCPHPCLPHLWHAGGA